MRLLYSLLDEPYFEHDLENVEYDADKFDFQIGARGLHRERRKVEWIARETILPPDRFERFSGEMFWRDPWAQTRDVLKI